MKHLWMGIWQHIHTVATTEVSPGLGELLAEILDVGGPSEKMSFFQIVSGPILSTPIYSKVCQYGPCKFLLKKNDQNLPAGHVKVLIFCHSSR
jgi:hypothetical protein